MSEAQLLRGDCLDEMKKMQEGCIDLTVTSPPYDNLRTYNQDDWQWGEQQWKPIIEDLYRVTTDGGVVVWIVGDATVKGSETGTSFRQALWAMDCGFNLHDTMIYEKAQACFGSNKCYLQSFEYMFILSKGMPKSINHIRDRRNRRGGVQESTVSSGKNNEGVSGTRVLKKSEVFGKRKNIWKYGVGGGNTGHPAPFPESLVSDHIISWSNEGDTVLDPFMGSGTTGVAAEKLGRNFIGIELDEQYFKVAEERIADVKLENPLEEFFE